MPNNATAPKLVIPDAQGEYRKNWLAMQTWGASVSPYACCYGATATFATLGGAGAPTVAAGWTAISNQDDWGFLAPADTTLIRAPYDRLYDFMLNFYMR